MDFFSAQETALKRTKTMVLLFGLAVFTIAVALYFLIVFVIGSGSEGQMMLWDPGLFFGTLLGVSVLVGCCSLFKVAQLRSGGRAVAASLGGRELDLSTKDANERKLLNVVEEMSIASGVSMPSVFIMEEPGINAFAAGFRTADAVVAVTRGCIEALNRDELQGVVAHEFSHILNGDMRLNIRLMGVLFGILAIAVIGQSILRGAVYAGGGRRRRGSDKGGGGAIAILLIGLGVMLIGYIGVLFGRLIQSMISRQREYLADASAVQFTRNPDGIGGALKKIGGASMGSFVANAHTQETAHFFFASALKKQWLGSFATHPPLPDRIRAIDPSWDGSYKNVELKSRKIAPRGQQPPDLSRAQARKSAFASPESLTQSVGQISAAAILQAESVHEKIKRDLDALGAGGVVALTGLMALIITASSGADDEAQLEAVAGDLDKAMLHEIAIWIPRLRSLNLDQRFAFFDAALPRSAASGIDALDRALSVFEALAHFDGELILEELALVRSIRCYIRDRRNPSRGVHSLSPVSMETPVCIMLSSLAHVATGDESAREEAFKAGAKKCARYLLKEAILLPESAVTYEAVDTALEMFVDLPAPQKRVLFEGALAVILADGTTGAEELSLIRVVAANLGLPLPAMLSNESDI